MSQVCQNGTAEVSNQTILLKVREGKTYLCAKGGRQDGKHLPDGEVGAGDGPRRRGAVQPGLGDGQGGGGGGEGEEGGGGGVGHLDEGDGE